MIQLRRETWKQKGVNRHVLVVRENGRLRTWTNVRGKNKFTLRQFKQNVKTTNSFNQNVKSVTIFKNKNRLVVTNERQKGIQKRTQIYAVVEFGRIIGKGQRSHVTKKFLGWSDLGATGVKGRLQATNRATNQAVKQGFANYDKLFIVGVTYEFHNWKRRGDKFTQDEQQSLTQTTESAS